MKFHGIKFHSPSFRSGGRKYNPSTTLAGLYFGVSGDGKLRGHWRSGWREHHSTPSSGDGVPDYAYDQSVLSLLGPKSSARRVYDSTPGKAYR